MIKVKYIGSKPSQVYRLNGQDITWAQDEVLEVSDSFESVLAMHPGNWEIVGHTNTVEPVEIPEEPVTEPPLVDLGTMDKPALQAYLQRELGQTVDPKWNATRLRKYVQDIMGKRAYDR
jgi:hypothetical protein